VKRRALLIALVYLLVVSTLLLPFVFQNGGNAVDILKRWYSPSGGWRGSLLTIACGSLLLVAPVRVFGGRALGRWTAWPTPIVGGVIVGFLCCVLVVDVRPRWLSLAMALVGIAIGVTWAAMFLRGILSGAARAAVTRHARGLFIASAVAVLIAVPIFLIKHGNFLGDLQLLVCVWMLLTTLAPVLFVLLADGRAAPRPATPPA
jgi:hypothetical protein